jgi:hypothetical protein
MSKWAKVLIGLGVLLVACVIYIWFFGVQTYYVWEVHRAARSNPAYWNKPVPLTDLGVSQSAGIKLSYLGYEFEVPWDDIDQETTKVVHDKIAVIVFRSGKVVSFWRSPANELVNGMGAGDAETRNALGRVIGKDVIDSDYDFKRAVLDVTPDDFSVFIPRVEAIRKGTLFLEKGIVFTREAGSGVFLFTTKEFKGIQYGNPQSRPKYFKVEMFNHDANIMFVFGSQQGAEINISQGDVNRMVQSVHKAGTPSSEVR